MARIEQWSKLCEVKRGLGYIWVLDSNPVLEEGFRNSMYYNVASVPLCSDSSDDLGCTHYESIIEWGLSKWIGKMLTSKNSTRYLCTRSADWQLTLICSVLRLRITCIVHGFTYEIACNITGTYLGWVGTSGYCVQGNLPPGSIRGIQDCKLS